jgi:type IV secretory pathway VirB2 component (pilin)
MDKAQKEKLIRNVVRTMKWAKWGGYFEVTLGWLALAFSLLPFTLGVLYFGLMLFSGEKHWDWQAARSSVEMVLVGTIPLIVLGIPWYAIRISHKKACGIVFAIVDILHDIRFGL